VQAWNWRPVPGTAPLHYLGPLQWSSDRARRTGVVAVMVALEQSLEVHWLLTKHSVRAGVASKFHRPSLAEQLERQTVGRGCIASWLQAEQAHLHRSLTRRR
jgi:hypothetical protein